MIKYILQVIIAIGLAYWGYVNLYPIEMVEYRFVEQYVGGWYLAPVLARILVGVNWGVSAFLILNIKPKKLIPFSLLGLVTLHLYNIIWELASESIVIVENYSEIISGKMWVTFVLLILMVGASIDMLCSKKSTDFMFKWVKYPVAILLVVLPFILNAIFPNDLLDETELFDEPFQFEVVGDDRLTSFTKDRVLVCFYSTSCPFCVRASKKIAVSQKRYPYFPEVFVLFQGDEYGAAYFVEVAGVDLSYSVLSLENYKKLTGLTFPRFQLVYQGNIDRKWDGQTFDFSVMNKLSIGTE